MPALMPCSKLRIDITRMSVVQFGLAINNFIVGNKMSINKMRGAIAMARISHWSARRPPASAPMQPVISNVTAPSIAVKWGKWRDLIA